MTHTGAGQLVGRDAEVDILRGLVSEVAQGRGGVGWVEGELGIGKSALIAEALSGAGDRGVRVFRGTGDEFSQMFGLRAMAGCLGVDVASADEHRREIASLLAGGGGGVDAVSAASERLLGLVDRECGRSPVALVLDDLQWADVASLGAWQGLTRVVDQIPLMLLSACRPVPARAEVDALRRAVARLPSAAVIELSTLDAEQVATMVAAWLSARPGAQLSAVLAQTAGNPLYVRELADVLTREGLVQITNGVAELAEPIGEGLSTVGAAIGRRLSFLPGPSRAVLRAGTLLGGRFTATDLALVSGRTVPDLLDVVRDAFTAGILADAGPELTFRHPLIRQALYDEVPNAARVALHRHMAQKLADAGASWERVAVHLLAASAAIDGWALTWLAGVPPSALYAQPAIAADLLQMAIKAVASRDPLRAVLRSRLSTALRLLGRWDDLVELGREELGSVGDPRLAGEIATNVLTALFSSGRFEEGLAEIDRVLASEQLDPPWRGRVLAVHALLLLHIGQTEQSNALALEAEAEGERDGDQVTVGMALYALALGAAPSEALEFIDRALTVLVADDPQSLDVRLMVLTNQLVCLSTLMRTKEFDEILPKTVALAENVGSPRLRSIQVVAALACYDRGEWDQALLYHEMATSPTDPSALLPWLGIGANIALRRGDRGTAEKHLAAVADIPYTTGRLRPSGGLLIATGALLAEADGQLDAAVALLAGWLDPEYGRATNVDRRSWLPELTRLALAAGDRTTAAAVVAAADRDAEATTDDVMLRTADICRAMVADDPMPLLEAADYFEGVGRRADLAFVCVEAAERFAWKRDVTSAQAAFERAAAIYEDMNADMDLRRMEARLRPLGIRRGPRSLHRRVDTGWEALTPAERRVAELVMQGESNPEIAARLFLSRRTVETHMSHILGKLKVRGRIEVAREAARALASGGEP